MESQECEGSSPECKSDEKPIVFTGGKPGYEFKITKLPDNFEDFKEFFLLFIDVFSMTFTLDPEKFERFKKYADPASIKKKDNCFF